MLVNRLTRSLILILTESLMVGALILWAAPGVVAEITVPALALSTGLLWAGVTAVVPGPDTIKANQGMHRIWSHLAQSAVFSGIFAITFFSWTGFEPGIRSALIYAVGMTGLVLPRLGLHHWLSEGNRNGSVEKNILVVGGGKVSRAVRDFMSDPDGNDRVIGFLDDRPQSCSDPQWLGKWSDAPSVLNRHPVQQVIITEGHQQVRQVRELIEFSESQGIRPALVLDLPWLSNRNYEVGDLGGLTILNFREVPLMRYGARLTKRIFDVVFSSMVLAVLAPVFLLIAIAIKSETPGPFFFRPWRIGRKGRMIRVYKFRSMIHQTDPALMSTSTQRDDQRITRVGRILRRFSLDELPQFINVLEGSMSVVGPRPHRINLDQTFREIFPSYSVRRFVKPGITGWAQINGWRGPTENKKDFKARALHDLWYIEHWSFGLDLVIIWLTVFGRKSHQDVF